MSFIVKLESSDGEKFDVHSDVIKQSETVNTLMTDLNMADTPEEERMPVPLPNVTAEVLKKVLEWCIHHKDDPPRTAMDEPKERRTDDIPEWDQRFLDVDQPMLFGLILAANYLNIKGLMDNACKTVAHMMKGKTAQEIRDTFHIKCDFTEEEMAQIRMENAWVED